MSQFLTSIHPSSHSRLPHLLNIKKIFNVPTVPMSPLSRTFKQPTCIYISTANSILMSRLSQFSTNQTSGKHGAKKKSEKCPEYVKQVDINSQPKEQNNQNVPSPGCPNQPTKEANIYPRQMQPPKPIVANVPAVPIMNVAWFSQHPKSSI